MDFEDPRVILVDEDNMSKPLMDGLLNTVDLVDNGVDAKENCGALKQKGRNKHLRVSFVNVAAREIKNVNDSYFGAYGSFGIHKEMISDKVRMDAYRDAIMKNPSLLKHATVLDVGCGTGILSLFAAQAGALRVIAVEASEKMASVATQIAKDNGLLLEGNLTGDMEQTTGVISVVHGMVEELDNTIQVPPHSVDVLLSEWMGYCLLYESMLSSILYARDRWLKPGGAILPDTATIFVAGFGRGGTSVPFWENVYGFDMSCISKEVVEDASQNPIVDVVGSHDIVTDAVIIQTFDLVTMNQDEMDFTSTFELKLKSDSATDNPMLWNRPLVRDRLHKKVLQGDPHRPFHIPIWTKDSLVSDHLHIQGTHHNDLSEI
ncbi:putative protein arginine N-methyltransferase 3 [Acorus calamus]|uniref:Uncharacterized protein n=1 Tax=Acorus calamus TaxID=4465 RepID=A0AAV9CVP4_ACOCL|nr:putative protein arginine N-methyltransferase 3 [Acorus calamus]